MHATSHVASRKSSTTELIHNRPLQATRFCTPRTIRTALPPPLLALSTHLGTSPGLVGRQLLIGFEFP